MLTTTFLAAIASTGMGLFVSSLFSNPDRAMTVAPILLMPQILFSGIIFTLEGATKYLSWITVCRWSMSGYGAGIGLTGYTESKAAESMSSAMNSFVDEANKGFVKAYSSILGENTPHLDYPAYSATYTEAQEEIFGIFDVNLTSTLITAWAVMLGLAILFIILARIVIGKVGKENS